jgi:hypothetical protein
MKLNISGAISLIAYVKDLNFLTAVKILEHNPPEGRLKPVKLCQRYTVLFRDG